MTKYAGLVVDRDVVEYEPAVYRSYYLSIGTDRVYGDEVELAKYNWYWIFRKQG